MTNSLRANLQGIVSAVVGVNVKVIDDSAGMTSIDRWDSFAVVNLVVAVEEEFEISVFPEELENFTNFGLLVRFVESKI